MIYPHIMGSNCDIYQGVTIGRNDRREIDGIATPTIGNNVKIYVNAVVIGNIKVGDNCIIGAGCVVTKSIPDNCTATGNPMMIRENSR